MIRRRRFRVLRYKIRGDEVPWRRGVGVRVCIVAATGGSPARRAHVLPMIFAARAPAKEADRNATLQYFDRK